MKKGKTTWKTKLLKVARTLGWAAFIVGFVVVMGAAINHQKAVTCSGIDVNIDYSGGLFFLDETDVKRQISTLVGDSVIGLPVGQIDIGKLEGKLAAHPHVKELFLYLNIKGEFNVEVVQRQPLIRIINRKGVSYYIDKSGDIMPTSHNFTARVPVATNVSAELPEIPKTDGNTELADLYRLALFIEESEFWSAQISQVVVNEKQQFEIIPRLGGHRILIGDAGDLERKFEQLMIFYKEGLPNVGWGVYKTIDLRFEDQIVCKKK